MQKIFITGGTSGLGLEAVLSFLEQGHYVIAGARSDKSGEVLLNTIKHRLAEKLDAIEIVDCNLSSLQSVQKACELIAEKHESLDQVILNAGTWNFDYIETEDGIEEIFQVNVITPLLITDRLIPLLKTKESAKVIFTSSALHQGTINFDDIGFETKYSGFKAYRQSKLGVILLTRWLQKNHGNSGIDFYCQHPGLVNTNLGRSAGAFSRFFFKLFGKSAKKGAQTLIHLALTEKSKLNAGQYYADSIVKETTKESYDLAAAQQLIDKVKEYAQLNNL